jgi:hypothetical protein
MLVQEKWRKKMKKVLVAVGLLVVVGILFVSWTMWKMDCRKAEIAMSNEYEAQIGNNVETALFSMRTKIKNVHNCTDEWANKFISVVAAQSKGREGGGMFKMSTESASLGLSPEMHMKLANLIEGEIGNFVNQQRIANSMWQNHKTYCEDPYHNWFGLHLIDKVKPEPKMVTSAATKDAMESKQMDEDLF